VRLGLDWCIATKTLVEMGCCLSDEIVAVVVHNDKETSKKWIPMTLEVGPYVTLQPESKRL